MKIFILLTLFISCSRFSSKSSEEFVLKGYTPMSKGDYADHFKYFESSYKKSLKSGIIIQPYRLRKYLASVASKIIKSNELFFTKNEEPSFTLINSEVPFHFSLPGRKIFLSSSLLRQYVKNESILFCVVAYELIRSEKSVYKKQLIYPTGHLSTARLLSLMRLPVKDKVEIHKWAYYLLSRASIETDSYLAWLQIKNRNSLDFSIQLGDIQAISQEESFFKNFVIKSTKNRRVTSWYKGSSRMFYQFINSLKGKK